MQRDRNAVARSWLSAAERDARAARLMLEPEPSLAAFHAQQAAEKALKALLVATLDDHPRSHSATQLARELVAHDPDVASIEADASALDLYYISSRYPDAVGDVDPGDVIGTEDARRAIARSERVLGFVRTRLSL